MQSAGRGATPLPEGLLHVSQKASARPLAPMQRSGAPRRQFIEPQNYRGARSGRAQCAAEARESAKPPFARDALTLARHSLRRSCSRTCRPRPDPLRGGRRRTPELRPGTVISPPLWILTLLLAMSSTLRSRAGAAAGHSRDRRYWSLRFSHTRPRRAASRSVQLRSDMQRDPHVHGRPKSDWRAQLTGACTTGKA